MRESRDFRNLAVAVYSIHSSIRCKGKSNVLQNQRVTFHLASQCIVITKHFNLSTLHLAYEHCAYTVMHPCSQKWLLMNLKTENAVYDVLHCKYSLSYTLCWFLMAGSHLMLNALISDRCPFKMKLFITIPSLHMHATGLSLVNTQGLFNCVMCKNCLLHLYYCAVFFYNKEVFTVDS